jgi:hypothetical protein
LYVNAETVVNYSGCASDVTAEEAAAMEAQFTIDSAAFGRVDKVADFAATIPVGKYPHPCPLPTVC